MDPWGAPISMLTREPSACTPRMARELTSIYGPLHWSTHLLGDIIEDMLYSDDHVDDIAEGIVRLVGEDAALVLVAAHPSAQANMTLFAMITNKLIDEL